MSPELSFILLVRNDDKILRRTIKALNHQTFSDFEIVVSDQTFTRYATDLERKLRVDPERLLFTDPVEGGTLWEQMRRAVEATRGEKVIFVSPWMWLENGAARQLVEAMDESQADMVAMRIMERLQGLTVKTISPEDETVTDTVIEGAELREYSRFISERTIISRSIYDKIYRRDLLLEALAVNFPAEEGCDEILNIQYLRHARKVLLLSYKGLNYNWQDTVRQYRYAALDDAKKTYSHKLVCGQNTESIREELRSRLQHHVDALITEHGWTREATVFFLERELRDPLWQEVGVTETAEELTARASSSQRLSSFPRLLKKLLR